MFQNVFRLTSENSQSVLKKGDVFVTGWNTCGLNNGECSHLCIAHSGEYTSHYEGYTHHCSCPTHFKLGSDNKTCYGECPGQLFCPNLPLQILQHYFWC